MFFRHPQTVKSITTNTFNIIFGISRKKIIIIFGEAGKLL